MMVEVYHLGKKSQHGGKLHFEVYMIQIYYITYLYLCFKYSMAAKLPTIDKRFAPSPSAYSITQYNVGGGNQGKWGFGTE